GGLSNNALTAIQDTKVLPDTENYYPALIEAIDKAERYVHFQTYVWRPDDVGERFLDALTRAAKRGVEVRLLVDELGSPEAKDEFFKPLIEAGGEFSWCLTVHPRRNRYFFNLRNHRKIQIIDSRIGFVGGMNIGKEYEGRNEDVGPWQDMHISVSGPVLNELQLTFVNDWNFATAKDLKAEDYFYNGTSTGSIPAAIVRSGPDNLDQVFMMSFIFFCNHAKKRLDLFTPYFAPDDPMLLAIAMAAQRGVRVRMMIPTLNEHQYMVDLGRAYYDFLMRAGVEIYELPDAVNHAKVYIADDEWGMIGSPNLDIRSIRLNFEVGLIFPDRGTVEDLDAYYDKLFERSEKVTHETVKQYTFWERAKLGFVRLFSPVL
ncbi:MAG: cardiolipin synthase, partial [Puniceicoccales bacterium]